MKLTALISTVFLSGCGMSAGDMVATQKACASVGMGVRWLVSSFNGTITSAQCDPTKGPK